MVIPPMCTISNFPFCIIRTSSGDSKRFRITVISLLLIGARYVTERTQPRIWRVQLWLWRDDLCVVPLIVGRSEPDWRYGARPPKNRRSSAFAKLRRDG